MEIKPMASGLGHQHSATELWHPPTTTPPPSPFITLLLSDYWWEFVLHRVVTWKPLLWVEGVDGH